MWSLTHSGLPHNPIYLPEKNPAAANYHNCVLYFFGEATLN